MKPLSSCLHAIHITLQHQVELTIADPVDSEQITRIEVTEEADAGYEGVVML